jgi:nitroreductase
MPPQSYSPANAIQAAEISQLIRHRRTIRNFTDSEVSQEQITDLLKAATQAVFPNTDNPPCRFILVTTPAGKQRAGELIMGTYSEMKLYKWMPGKINQMMIDRIVKIPALLFVIAKQDADAQHNEWNFSQVCAMLHSFSLLAWDEALGLVWGTGDFMNNASLVAGLGLQADEKLHCLMYLGHFDKVPKTKSRTPAVKKWTIRT